MLSSISWIAVSSRDGWGDNCFLSPPTAIKMCKKIVVEAVKNSCLELREAGFFPDRVEHCHLCLLMPRPQSPLGHIRKFTRRVDGTRDLAEKKNNTYPLTDAQQEIWFSSLMGPMASCAYNEPFSRSIPWRSWINRFFSKSLEHVLSKHESLKLRFDAQQPIQFLDNSATYQTGNSDWSRLSDSDCKQRCDEFVTQLATTPFDLTKGPLVRLRLVKIALESTILYVSRIISFVLVGPGT